jgi:hypothetical protein
MEKKVYKTKEEVLIDLVKAQDQLYKDSKDTNEAFIEKSKLEKVFKLNNLLKSFDNK